MQNDKHLIRIVIPAYNADRTIRACIDAISNAMYRYQSTEIIVVDNGLNQDIAELVNDYPVQLIKRTNHSSAAYARNAGAEKFSDGILVFIDSDVIIEKECLNRLIQPIIEESKTATIGNYSQDVKGLNFAQRYKQLYIHHVYNQRNSAIKNDFWTAISAIDAATFHQLNGFDSSFKGANGEDQEFGIRLTKNNYSVVSVTNAYGQHINPYTVGKLIRNDFRKGVTALSNSIKNHVPLKDNRHAKPRSIYAVFFAVFFLLTSCLAFLNLQLLYFAFLFLLGWMSFRFNLMRIYLQSKNLIFILNAILLTYILDLVRFASVVYGFIYTKFARRHSIQQNSPIS